MPELIDDKYEVYRIVTDWEALHEGFRDRVEDLEVTRTELDTAGKFTGGYASKLLCDPPIKNIGKGSLPKMLRATGMALVLVIDDERFAPIKAEMAKRQRPLRTRSPAIAGKSRPAWLFNKDKARESGKRRFALMTDAQRKKHQRKAQRASAAARRRKNQGPDSAIDSVPKSERPRQPRERA